MARPWYSHYMADYERKTKTLTMIQDGAYRRMLDCYYSTGEPLPANDDDLFRICRAFDETEREAVRFVASKFFHRVGDTLHQERADEELAKADQISAIRSMAGKSRGKRVGALKSKRKANDEHLLTQSQSQSHTPSLRSGARVGAAQRTKLLDDWPSAEDQKKALAYWTAQGREDLHSRLADEIQKARAHHLGKGTRAADWSQVWVTWYSRAVEFNRAARQTREQAQIIKLSEAS